MKYTPEIMITVKPAPLDAILDDEFSAQAFRLMQTHCAAPALLDALKTSVDTFRELNTKHLNGAAAVVRALLQQKIEGLEALIAKAEGR